MPRNETVAAALAPHRDWREAYPFIEAQAKKILDAFPSEAPRLSTNELVALIYSPDGPQEPKVKERIYKALRACAGHGLARYVTLGEREKIGNVMGLRMLWGHPANQQGVKARCPTCKRPL